MANIKALIFDLDGVLVDTAAFHYQAWKILADELGINFTLEDNEQLKGVSRVKSFEILLSLGNLTLEQSQKDVMLQKKNDLFLKLIATMKHEDILPPYSCFVWIINTGHITALKGIT